MSLRQQTSLTAALIQHRNMTPLDQFAELARLHRPGLSDEALKTFRDLIDLQADLILDAYLTDLADKSNDL